MSELALKLIDEAKRANTKVLDLGNCGLTELPEELFELTHLEELNLGNKYWDYKIEKWIKSKNEGKPNNLSSLKSHLSCLKTLKILRLNGDEKYGGISDISVLKNLSSLQILDLSYNQISESFFLENLTGLQTLDLRFNKITYMSFLEKLTNLQILNLRFNKITNISSLENLTNLQTLELSFNKISDGSFLEKLNKLRTLNLCENKILDFSFLEKLIELQRLDLSYNQISDGSFLEKLNNLKMLDLSHNKLTDITFLEKLDNLKVLNLSFNQILDISLLKNLTTLQRLDLSSNQILNGNDIENLSNLRTLELGQNEILDISFLRSLSSLQNLDLNNNQISDISSLENLSSLQTLDLSKNKISNVHNLSNLMSLKSLYLSYNEISDYHLLEKLYSLKYLHLSDNQVSDISFLGKLTNLQRLSLRYNKITDISILTKLKKLDDIFLFDNPIEGLDTLDEYKNHINDLREYFARQSEQNKIKVRLPVKIILLGNHASGKSTFANFFVHHTLQSMGSTHILRIVNYPVNETDILPHAVFFDFGGQDYYHGLYRIYLSNQSINLIFWREKHNNNGIVKQDSNGLNIYNFNLNYWLAQKDYFERDSETPDTVFLIKTHTDKSHKETVPLTSYNYKKDFDCCLAAKSEDHTNRNYLKETLKAEIETLRQQNATEEPQWYIDFLTFLYNHKPDNPFEPLTFEYILENHYERNTETEIDKIDFLKVNLEQIHKSGIILFYDTLQLQWSESSAPKTKYGLVWTNPSAVVEKLHQEIFSRDKLLKGENSGIATLKELGLNPETDAAILQLLKIQKVIFYHAKQEKYIIPNFLRLSSEFDSNYRITKKKFKHSYTLQFKHFIPFGLINELMCYFGQDVNAFCRNGIIFEVDSQAVSVELVMEKLQISISYLFENVTSNHDLDKYLFMVILAFYTKNDPIEFHRYDSLKKEFERRAYFHIDIDQESPYRTYSEEENRDFKNMLAVQKKDEGFFNIFNKENIHIPKDMLISTNQNEFVLFKDLNIEGNEILAYDEAANSLNKNISKSAFNSFMENPITDTKKIFVSYSKKDVEAVEKGLLVSLKNLERQGKINIWYDKELQVGDEWDAEIKTQLQKADIILLVVSPDFIATDYIWDVEIEKALERHDKGEAKVIPIILRPCDWTGDATPFSKLQAIPTKGKPITTYENVDEAWLEVLKQIKKVID